MKAEHKITILVAGIAFIASILGTLVAGFLQDSLWEKQADFQSSSFLYSKKIELLERTARVFSKRDLALKFQVTNNFYLQQLSRISEKKGFENPEYDKALKSAIEYFKQTDELFQEYDVLKSLNGIFFGQEAKDYIDEMQRKYEGIEFGQMSEEEVNHLFSIMYDAMNSKP